MADMPLYSVAAREGTVTVEVGPRGVKYSVHKAFLKHCSQYFRVALKKAHDSHVMPLRDVEPSTFNIFINWLYTRSLPDTRAAWIKAAEISGQSESAGDPDLAKFKTYVFANEYNIPDLRGAMNQAIVRQDVDGRRPPLADVIIYAYKNLHPDNPLLRFLVDTTCAFRNPTLASENEKYKMAQLPRPFLNKLMETYGNHTIALYSGLANYMPDINPRDYCEHPQARG